MSEKTLRIPLSLSEILFIAWNWYLPWADIKRILKSRYLEVKEADIILISHRKGIRTSGTVWCNFRVHGDKVADFVTPVKSPAGKVLVEHFERTNGGTGAVMPKHQLFFLSEVKAYLKYSPSLWYISSVFLLSLIWFAMKFPSVEFFMRENCDQKCATALAGGVRILVLITMFQVLGIAIPAFNFWRAKRNLKDLRTVGAIRTEFALLAIVVAVISFQFASKLSGPTGTRAVLLYSRWYKGEPVKLTPQEKAELASTSENFDDGPSKK